MKIFRLLWPLVLLAPGARAAAPSQLPLGDGEMLKYRVSWAVLPGAGELTVSAVAATDPSGAPMLRIISATSTRGLAWLLLPFHARAESLFDNTSGRLLWLGETSDTRSKHAAHTVTFDYAKSTAEYADSVDPANRQSLPLPGGYPMDLVTCLLEARNWALKPGGTHDAVVMFNDEIFELTVHAVGYEDVTTPFGNFHTLVLEPRMEKTPPKGMFKRGSKVRVWIAQGDRRLPVRFRVDFKFGAGVANLVEYRPPTAGP